MSTPKWSKFGEAYTTILILLAGLSLIYGLVTWDRGNVIKGFKQMAFGTLEAILFVFISLI